MRLEREDEVVAPVVFPTPRREPTGRGARLDTAREQDRIWRDERQERIEGTLRNTGVVADLVATGLRRVVFLAACLFISSGLITLAYGLLGANGVPDWVMVIMAVGLVSLLAASMAGSIWHYSTRKFTSAIRGLASRQEIELSSDSSEPGDQSTS